MNFNPLSPCGKRLIFIFPRAPGLKHFNPLSPCGKRPNFHNSSLIDIMISIHSPRVGRDLAGPMFYRCFLYFNPLSPCGKRRGWKYDRSRTCKFQSTLPVWEETRVDKSSFLCHFQFQSTLPVWEETWRWCPRFNQFPISIHSPRVGRD